MLHVKSIKNMYNIKKHINVHITKSIAACMVTGILLKKPKEKVTIHVIVISYLLEECVNHNS